MSRDSRVEDKRREQRRREEDKRRAEEEKIRAEREKRRIEARKRKRKREQQGEKKHRSCCASCAIVIAVLIVVTAGLLYGGGFFAWKQYAEPMFGISFNDALALVGSTYIAKDSKIVTNPYEEADLDGFYGSLSDALYLDKSVNLKESLVDVLNGFVLSMTKSDDSSTTTQSVSTAEEGSSSSITGNAAFDSFLQSLSFDFSKLKDYQDEYATPQVLEITDKQTAAFLDNTIDLALDMDEVKNKLPEQVRSVSLKEIVDIPQVVITNEKENGLDQVALTLTVRVNLRSTIKEVASSYHKALSAVAYLLPKKLYATITIFPNNYLKEAKITINSFSDKRMNDAYSIANYFLKDTQYGSINGILQMVNQKAIEAIEKVQDIVPVNFLPTGSVEMHPIKALMNMLGATELTETQFFCMVRDLCLPTFDDVKTNLGFSEDVTYASIESYLNENKAELINEISRKYALEVGYLTPDNMLDKLQGIGGESSELIEKVSLSNLDFSDATYNANNAKVHVPYAGLAGLLDGYINKSSTEGEGTTQMNFKIINCLYDADEKTLSLVLQIGVLEAISSSLSTGSPFSGFIGQIIPENLYIKASVCLEDGSEEPASIAINARDAAGTQELLDTIGQLTSSMGTNLGLDYTSLSSTIATSIRDGIKNLNEQLGTDLIFNSTAAYLPSIYDVLANKILYSSEVSAENLTPARVYLVVKGACVVDDDIAGVNKAQDLTSFTEVVNTRYGITNDDYKIKAPQNETDDTIVDQLKGFSTTYNQAINGSQLAQDWTAAILAEPAKSKAQIMHESFSAYAKEDEAASIFEGAFNVNADGVNNITLNKVMVVDDSNVRLIYSCEYETDSSTKYASLIPHFVINVKLDKDNIDSSDPCVSVTLNSMTSTVLGDFELMCQRLGITSFNMTNIEQNADTAIKGGLQDLFSKVEVSFDATSDTKAIYFGSIYDLAYKNVHTDEAYQATDVADTIAELFDEVEVYGQDEIDTTADKYDPAYDADTNPNGIQATADIYALPPTINMQGTLTARNVGAAVLTTDMTALKTGIGYTGDLLLTQSLMIDYSDTTYDTEQAEFINEVSSLFDGVTSGEYIITGFEIETASLYTSSLVPAKIYLTSRIDIATGNVNIAYNNLTATELLVLKSLAGESGSKAFDVDTIEAEMTTFVKTVKLFSYTYSMATYNVTFEDVLDAHAGSIDQNLDNSKLCGNFVLDYTRAMI